MAGYSNVEDCMAEFNAADAWANPSARDELLRILKENGSVNDFETEIIRRNGSRIWILFSATIFPKQGFLEGSIVDINERKQAEEALLKSEERFRYALNNSIPVIYNFNLNTGTYDYLSPSVEKIYGYSAEEFIDGGLKQTLSKFHPDDLDKMDNHLEKLLAKKLEDFSPTVEYRFKHPELGYRWMSDTRTVIFDNNGKPISLVGNAYDITERKQAEKSLLESEKKLRIQNQIANIFLTKSDEDMYGEILSIVLDIMESKFGVFGYIDEQGDLVCPSMTRDIWDQCQISDKTIVFPENTWGESIWGNGLRTGLSAYSNKPFKVPEGHVPVDRCLTAPITYQRKSIGLLTVANKSNDYTEPDKQLLEEIAEHVAPVLNARIEKERSDKALREKAHNLNERVKELHCLHGISEIIERDLPFEEMFQEIVNHIPPAWQYPEAACARILINGQSFTSSNFNTSVWNQACDITVHGERTGVLEVYYLKQIPDMDEGPFLKEERDLIISIAESLGKVMERTVTEGEKLKLEAQLQQAQKMEAIGTLAGGIAHDFNNLLMAIQGRTSMVLMNKDSSHPDFRHMKGIEDNVESAADLTKQLLGFARGGKYEVKPTDLNGLIKKENRMFGRTKKEIAIRGKYQENLWSVEVDRGQVQQVLLNLYVNAWQAMPAGGELYIETQNITLDENYTKPYQVEPGSYVQISFTDTGPGMDKATRERIFEPFFTTKKMGRGTGLGLASAYGIIKNHGGFINVYSEKGHGATFNIYLPASEKEIIEEKNPPEAH